MSKNITFKKEDIICMTLNMSEAHIEFICKKYDLDFESIIDFKQKNVKYVYVDIKNYLVVAHLINNKLFVHTPYTTKINSVTLESIKPLSTPKLPKSKPSNITTTTKIEEIIVEIDDLVEVEDVIDIDSLLKEKEVLDAKISKMLVTLEEEMVSCVENEDYEKAAILRDKINKLK
jgi:hypothetical protein